MFYLGTVCTHFLRGCSAILPYFGYIVSARRSINGLAFWNSTKQTGVPKKSIDIFKYHDYRRFLHDFLTRKRSSSSGFSLRSFAAKAGLSSHSFPLLVIKGKRNLTRAAAAKLVRGMGLNPREGEFFNILVQYNQASGTREKDRLYQELNNIRRNTAFYRLNKDHLSYFEHWYFFVLRELVVYGDWKGDFAGLGKLVQPPITAAEARAGVKVLVNSGLVRKNKHGSYEQCDKFLTTKGIPGHLIKKMRLEFLELGRDASRSTDPESRHMASSTIGLSREAYYQAREILEEARRKIIALSDADDIPWKIFQINTQLFALSRELPRGEDLHE